MASGPPASSASSAEAATIAGGSSGRRTPRPYRCRSPWSFGLKGEGQPCCGMGREQQQADDRARGGDAGGDKAGGAEAVEEGVGRCGVDGVPEGGVAVKAGAVGEPERAADGVVGGARE